MPLAVAGCGLRHRHPLPATEAHYEVGEAYQAGGIYRYPRTQFDYDATGLATVITAHAPLTADGEAYDATALVGAHQTLQLPAIVRVTNLESGRQILLRLNDRGPDLRGRMLALSRRAAELLGPGTEPGVLRVRVQVEDASSRQLAATLAGGDAPALPILVAPAGDVVAEPLLPPSGTGSEEGRFASVRNVAAAPVMAQVTASLPLRLPEQVTQLEVRPTALYVDLGDFSRQRYADLLARRMARLGAQVSTSYGAPRGQAFRVRVGPLSGLSDADATLDQAIAAGVVDARIIVD